MKSLTWTYLVIGVIALIAGAASWWYTNHYAFDNQAMHQLTNVFLLVGIAGAGAGGITWYANRSARRA